jgi:hypothetical protein
MRAGEDLFEERFNPAPVLRIQAANANRGEHA